MSLQVTTFVNGTWRENCYILSNEAGDAIVIDPGSRAPEIIDMIDQAKYRVHGIVNTHGHFDHIGAVAELKERYAIPFYLHSADESLVRRANTYKLVFDKGEFLKIPSVTTDISSLPAHFHVGPFELSWTSTPGHTDGSVFLQVDQILFSGDTLMQGAIGRTDLPGGNRALLPATMKTLQSFAADLTMYPGHGPVTTIGAEFAPGTPAWKLCNGGD